MRFGYCVNMIAADPHGVGYDWIPQLAALGFDYIDLPMAQMMALDDGAFRALVADPLAASGLPCVCVNNLFPASIRLTGPDADWNAALRYAEKAFSRAEILGARRAVFGSSGARNVPLFWPGEQATTQLAEFLGLLADRAATHDVTLVLEPLNRGESNILTNIAESVRLCRQVSHPAVQMLADYYHMSLSGEAPSDLVLTAGRLRHVHIARPLGRGLPTEGDGEDYHTFLSMLETIGYVGGVSIEAYAPEHTAEAIRTSLAYLRSQLED